MRSPRVLSRPSEWHSEGEGLPRLQSVCDGSGLKPSALTLANPKMEMNHGLFFTGLQEQGASRSAVSLRKESAGSEPAGQGDVVGAFPVPAPARSAWGEGQGQLSPYPSRGEGFSGK